MCTWRVSDKTWVAEALWIWLTVIICHCNRTKSSAHIFSRSYRNKMNRVIVSGLKKTLILKLKSCRKFKISFWKDKMEEHYIQRQLCNDHAYKNRVVSSTFHNRFAFHSIGIDLQSSVYGILNGSFEYTIKWYIHSYIKVIYWHWRFHEEL